MPKHDDVHFEMYSPQTQAKHEILASYLPAYLSALKNKVDRFHYIDGFAGRGTYGQGKPGSPLVALQKIDEAKVCDRTSISLVEKRESYFQELKSCVEGHALVSGLLNSPLIRQGKFSEHFPEILNREVYGSGARVATFAFIDPCGIEDVRMADLISLLKIEYCELLLFFNYDAVNRIGGSIAAGTMDMGILSELYGSESSIESLVSELKTAGAPSDREGIIRDTFIRSLKRGSGARFSVPFRFSAKRQDRTSHYLVHVCNNPLGFKIMKSVMWEVGRDDAEEYGRLEFDSDPERGQLLLFRPDIENQKKSILDRLRRSACKVSEFSVNWMNSPNDYFSEQAYKKMLLDLEKENRLAVFDKENQKPAPTSSRRKMKGKPTLGNDYWLRLSNS
ncbi:MAG: three-Cys-motif partner protein TcmP [Planctomycetes bacterium]|nr:three-Cys-motif partner protein TcmP [Planctomycetota bacterium]